MRTLISAGVFLFTLAAIAGWDARQGPEPTRVVHAVEFSTIEATATRRSADGKIHLVRVPDSRP